PPRGLSRLAAGAARQRRRRAAAARRHGAARRPRLEPPAARRDAGPCVRALPRRRGGGDPLALARAGLGHLGDEAAAAALRALEGDVLGGGGPRHRGGGAHRSPSWW